MKKLFSGLEKAVHAVSKGISWMGGIALFSMCLLTFVDVFMRYFFKNPITGSQEIVTILLVITVYGGLPCGVMQKMLVETDVVTSHFPIRVQRIMQCFFSLLCTILCGMMVVRVFQQTMFYFSHTNLTTQILKIHYGPFYAVTCFGCLIMGLELLIHTVKYFRQAIDPNLKDDSGKEEEDHE